MSKVLDAVDQVRNEGRVLHQKIGANMTNTKRDHAVLRADLQEAAADAKRLAGSLRTLAKDRRTDETDHLAHAASLFDEAAKGQTPQEMRSRVRKALQFVSLAIAAKRFAARKRHG